ncbi:MAG: lipopolysaccharide biosynthesis protein [Vicinamibacterales bacterium]
MFQRVKQLFRSLLIYGVGDVATSLVSLLLLPIFTKFLGPSDIGVVIMLLSVEAVTKVVFRWGVDTAFMRLYYDCTDQAARQRLASTIFFFMLAVNGTLLAAGVLSAGWLATLVLGSRTQSTLIALTMANTFVAGFYFIPYQVLRISNKPKQYVALTFGRSAGTIVARVLFVLWARWGVFGIVMADVTVTVLQTLVLIRWFAPLIRPVFSRAVAREALGFGLPRIPHSLAQQVIGVADSYVLRAYGTLADVGLYGMGARFGVALKLFLSAFESVWTPFFLAVMREDDAPRTYGMVSTYVVAVLVLLVAGVCVAAGDLMRLLTEPAFHAAAAVTPWIAIGVMFQGFYLLGSIGLVIRKRTTVYPITTGMAAVASVTANLLLVPRFGMIGAAWANVVAYATLAIGTTAFSWRLYPIPYEWSRLARIGVAGGLAYVVATRLVPASMSPWTGLLVRGAATVPTYVIVLYLTRFFHAGELQLLQELRQRTKRQPVVPPPAQTEAEVASDVVPGEDEITMEVERERADEQAKIVSPDSRPRNR